MKEARFDIIFQGAGDGCATDFTFQYSGGSVSDAVFSFDESSQEHSNGDLGGRYHHFDLSNAQFFPTKELLEEQTRRIFGTAPDEVSFNLIELPMEYIYSSSSYKRRSFWWKDYKKLSPDIDPRYQKIIDVETTGSGALQYRIRHWHSLGVYRSSAAAPGVGTGHFRRRNFDGSHYEIYWDFDRLIADHFQGEDRYGEVTTTAEFAFTESNSEGGLLQYQSFMPFPHQPGNHYAIERETSSSASIMAIYCGDRALREREISLSPRFVLEQSLVGMGAAYNKDLEDNDYPSSPEIWNIGFAESLPDAQLKEEKVGTLPPLFFWENGSAASDAAILGYGTNTSIWTATGAALAMLKIDDSNLGIYYSRHQKAEIQIDFSFSSGNSDEGKNTKVDINYIFLFRSDGTVGFISELPSPASIPQGCSFDLTATIEQSPFLLVI